MAEIFELEAKDLIKLRKFYKRAPRLFAKATASLLNSFAFGTRTQALLTIKAKMQVRNPRFVASRLRVQKVRQRGSIRDQESIAGSIESPRFTGWEEQELGTRTKRTRVATLLARGNQFSKQIKPSVRLKPGKNFRDANDFSGGDETTRTAALINAAKRGKIRTPFIVGGNLRGKLSKLKSGLYRVRRKKLEKLQSFEPKSPQPKRIRWMTMARTDYFKETNIKRLWGRTLERVLK